MTPTLLVVPDGAAEPVRAGVATSLEAAATPALDRLAATGERLRVATVPDGLHPGSEVGLPGLLGVSLDREPSRGRIEAAAAGVDLGDDEAAWRLDLRPPTPATPDLVAALDAALGELGGRVVALRGHRMLLVGPAVWGDAPPGPHQTEQPLREFAVGAFGGVAKAARVVLRGAGMEAVAWPWGRAGEPAGTRWPDLTARHGRVVVVTAAGVAAGVAALCGARVVPASGTAAVTAAAAAIDDGAALVVVHDDRPDEAGHRRDPAAKAAALEALDREVLTPLLDVALAARAEVLVASDHGCDPHTGRHTSEPVPAVRWHPALEEMADGARSGARCTERDTAGLPVTPAPQLVTPRPPTRRFLPLDRSPWGAP